MSTISAMPTFPISSPPPKPRRTQPITSLSELKYTPPTPPRKLKSVPSTLTREPSTLRRTPKVTAASAVFKSFILKASGKGIQKQQQRSKIIHFGDARRIPIDRPLCKIDSYDFALLDLEEAQKREDIVYRMVPCRS